MTEVVEDLTEAAEPVAPQSNWSPPSGEEVPPQVVASTLEAREQRVGVVWVGRKCGHRVFILINRGGDYCNENCRKSHEEGQQ